MLSSLRQQLNSMRQKGALHIFVGSFLTKFVSFFSSIFLVKILSKSDYGVLGYINNFYGYFLVFMGMGASNAILRYVVLADDDDTKYSYYRYSCAVGTIFNIAILAVAFTINSVYSHPSSFSEYSWLIYFVLLIIPLKFIANCTQALRRSVFRTQSFAIISFIISTLWVLSRLLGAYVSGLNGAVFYGLLIEAIIAAVLFIAAKKEFFPNSVYTRPSKQLRKEMNLFSLQYMLTNGLWQVFALNDVFLIGKLCNDSALLADYNVACVLPSNMSIFCSCIGMFIAPYFTLNEHKKNWEWIKRGWQKTMLFCCAAIFACSLILFIFAKPIVLLIYGERYLSAIPTMRVLLFSNFIDAAFRFPSAHILSSMGKIKYNLFVTVFGVIAQFIGDILAIKLGYGIIGVAWVNVIVYAIMAAIVIWVFITHYVIHTPSDPDYANLQGNKKFKYIVCLSVLLAVIILAVCICIFPDFRSSLLNIMNRLTS